MQSNAELQNCTAALLSSLQTFPKVLILNWIKIHPCLKNIELAKILDRAMLRLWQLSNFKFKAFLKELLSPWSYIILHFINIIIYIYYLYIISLSLSIQISFVLSNVIYLKHFRFVGIDVVFVWNSKFLDKKKIKAQ